MPHKKDFFGSKYFVKKFFIAKKEPKERMPSMDVACILITQQIELNVV